MKTRFAGFQPIPDYRQIWGQEYRHDPYKAKHKLPEPGVKRANEIRDQSKKLRDAYRRKNAAALRKAKEENDPRKVAEYEGIEKRIFERVLVRDLKKLVHDEKDAPKKEP